MELGIMGYVLMAVAVIVLAMSFFVVEQQQEAVIERFGKFVRTAKPGLNMRIPLIESVYRSDMRLLTETVELETKTKDNVFVGLKVSVQYQIEDIYKATYKLSNVKKQLASYVTNKIISQIPTQTLDEVFSKKDEVAQAVKTELEQNMKDFGYAIAQTLIEKIEPDQKVKESMNQINAAQREQAAATAKGETDKILKIKAAEAEAEAKRLQGKGIADERAEIAKGLENNIRQLSESTHSTPEMVMSLLLMNQHYDTLKSLGKNGNLNTLMVPYQPGAVGDMQTQMLGALEMTNKGKIVGPATPKPRQTEG